MVGEEALSAARDLVRGSGGDAASLFIWRHTPAVAEAEAKS